jgi:hypothetical protein
VNGPENVECQTCGGLTTIGTDRLGYPVPCPDCTPENVETPCDYCGGGGIHPEYVIENCPKCSTPENVDGPSER